MNDEFGISVEEVTPEIASTWLAANVNNRKVRKSIVIRYAGDMERGLWRLTGEAIKFDRLGRLIDGQHRLLAVIRSGMTIRMVVVRGVEPAAQHDLDSGVVRRFNDVLALRGEHNCGDLATLVRLVLHFERDWARSIEGGSALQQYSTSDLLETLDNHPELRDIVKRASAWGHGTRLARSIIGLLFWRFSRLDEESYEDAVNFFDRLSSPVNHNEGDPIFVLRRLLENKQEMSSKWGRGGASRQFQMAVTIKAWNAYRRGETVGLLRYRAGGSKPEAFPVPV